MPRRLFRQEGEVIEDVDAGDLVIELHCIEECWLAFLEHDVAEVKVAMTLADEAGVTSSIEQCSATIQPMTRLGRDD